MSPSSPRPPEKKSMIPRRARPRTCASPTRNMKIRLDLLLRDERRHLHGHGLRHGLGLDGLGLVDLALDDLALEHLALVDRGHHRRLAQPRDRDIPARVRVLRLAGPRVLGL